MLPFISELNKSIETDDGEKPKIDKLSKKKKLNKKKIKAKPINTYKFLSK